VAQDDLKGALAGVIAPLIEADGGELFLVPTRGRVVHLHLRGRFSGCPGNLLVAEHVLRPVVEAADPAAKVQITSGAILPDGAERILATGGAAQTAAPQAAGVEASSPDDASTVHA